MPRTSAIDLFKRLETHDQITIILEILRAYKDIGNQDVDQCVKRLKRAFAWWGISDDIAATTLFEQLNNNETALVETNLFKITVTLIHLLSPTQNIESLLDIKKNTR